MAEERSKTRNNGAKDETSKVHPAVRAAQDAENRVSPVQPIEVVRNVSVEGDETAEVVKVFNRPNLQQDGSQLVSVEDDEATRDSVTQPSKDAELCWNCANHNKTTELEDDGTCSDCGFSKSDLYNGNIEQQRAHERSLREAGY